MPFLPRNEPSSSNIHPGSDPALSSAHAVPWPEQTPSLRLTAHTLSFSKMKLVLHFAKVQNRCLVKTKAEPSLYSPSSLQTSAIYNFSPQQIMPSGHCFTAEHQQKFVLTLPEPFWTDLSCAISTMQITQIKRNSIFLWPWSQLLHFSTMAFMITTFPHQAFAKYLVFSSLILLIISLFKPLQWTGFGDSGTTERIFFPPFVCKKYNFSCSPTFCLLRIQITIFQLTVFAFKLSGFYRQHYSYICHLFSPWQKTAHWCLSVRIQQIIIIS